MCLISLYGVVVGQEAESPKTPLGLPKTFDLALSKKVHISDLPSRLAAYKPLRPSRDFKDYKDHKLSSSSAVNSLYNLINKRQANRTDYTSGQKSSAEKIASDTRQAQVALGAPQAQQFYPGIHPGNQQVFNQYIPQGVDLNLMDANDAASHMQTSTYPQSISYPASNREHLLANFYPSGFDNSPYPKFHQPNKPLTSNQLNLQETSTPLISAKSKSKRYSSRVLQTDSGHQIDKPIRLSTKASQTRPKLSKTDSNPMPRPQPDMKTRKMLTNEQLMSLIDELKEFNSKQASAIQSTIPSVLHEEITNHDNQPSSASDELPQTQNESNVDDRDDSRGEPTSDKVDKLNKDDSTKMNTDDLANFAKFLMSKEGANLKFQLGLDKDSPDDGDEADEQDALLETTKSSIKSKPQRLADEWDSKHQELAKQLDKLVDRVSNKAESSSKKDDDEADRARKRRDQNSKIFPTKANSTLKHEPFTKKQKRSDPKNPGQDENFAKTLIKQEIIEDQLEQDRKLPMKEKNESGVMTSTSDKDISRAEMQSGVPTRSKMGEEQMNYGRKDRYTDLAALNRALERARLSKTNLRSKMMKTPFESLIKRATDGKLGIKVERKNDRKIILKGDNGSSYEVDIPRKNADAHKTKSSISHGQDTIDDPTNSELTVSQAEPTLDSGNVQTITMQSGKPIHDEYPVSERVSDRLSKLSNNLDRYFNDGFLKEIETKSSIKDDGKDQSSEYQQPQPSDINESTQQTRSGIAKKSDRDFDVNVGVDGRVDEDSDVDDLADDEPGRQKSKHSKKLQSLGKRDKATKPSRRMRKQTSKVGGRKPSVNSTVKGLRKSFKPTENEEDMKNIQRDEAASRENIEFESHGKIAPNLDPVEVESLDTPIGPDNDVAEPNLANMDELKVTTGGSNSSSRYRKKPMKGEKFFEEPAWH